MAQKEVQSIQLESYLAKYASLSASDNFIFYYSGQQDVSGDEPNEEDEVQVRMKNPIFRDLIRKG